MDLINPYQPPAPVPSQEVGLWKRLIERMRRARGASQSQPGFFDEQESVESLLSGRPFMEYGVVFSAMPGVSDRYFAAMPLAIDDEVHRRRNIGEAARVLRQLVARVDGLATALSRRQPRLSMVPCYQQLDVELCLVWSSRPTHGAALMTRTICI